MLDLKEIRRDPEAARAALDRRRAAEALDEVLALDARRRELLPELEGGRARQNEASKRIPELQKAGEDASRAIAEMRELAPRVKRLEGEVADVQGRLSAALAGVPNLPDPSAPEREDVVLREEGEAGASGADHLELLGGWIDLERGARVAGSRFAYLKGPLVMLELALVRFALETVQAHGFMPTIPPVLVREEAMYGTGFLPDTEQQIYRLAEDDLYLVGTSEVPLAALHAGEILEEEELPRRYAGFSPCFRREAGAAGKDTRGIFRVHQFDKVEMFAFVSPEDSGDEHERLLAIEEELVQALGLPYRVMNVAAGDLGASATKKYDIEAWFPSQGRYREVTSTSNTTDFQARRLDVRFRGVHGLEPVHTLNGTAATGRHMLAVLENYQQEDGSVAVPETLLPYGAPARVER